MSLIEVTGIKKSYKRQENVLKGIDLKIQENEFYLIMGQSGCGKTTLLYTLSGLLEPTEGKVVIFGKEYKDYTQKELIALRNNEIGFVFQFFNLFEDLTVYDNLMYAKSIFKKTNAYTPIEVLEMVGIADLKDKFPGELSGGQAQRVCIARAIINKPKIIFADEPVGSLDSATGEQILNLLEKLRKDLGITIVMVSHLESNQKYATKVVRMKDGLINEN